MQDLHITLTTWWGLLLTGDNVLGVGRVCRDGWGSPYLNCLQSDPCTSMMVVLFTRMS